MCYTICYVIMITLQQATHKGGSWHSFSTLRQDCCISCGMNESVELSSIYHTTVPVSLTVGAHMGASNKCWTWKGQFHSILVWRLRNSTGRVGSKRGDGGKNYNFELKPLFVSRRKSNMLVFSDPSSVHTFVTIMKSQDICSCLEVSFFFSETEVQHFTVRQTDSTCPCCEKASYRDAWHFPQSYQDEKEGQLAYCLENKVLLVFESVSCCNAGLELFMQLRVTFCSYSWPLQFWVTSVHYYI